MRSVPLSQIQIIDRGNSARRVTGEELLPALQELAGRRRDLEPEEIALELRGLAEVLVAAGTAEAPLALGVVATFAETVLTRAAARLEALTQRRGKAANLYEVRVRGGRGRRR